MGNSNKILTLVVNGLLWEKHASLQVSFLSAVIFSFEYLLELFFRKLFYACCILGRPLAGKCASPQTRRRLTIYASASAVRSFSLQVFAALSVLCSSLCPADRNLIRRAEFNTVHMLVAVLTPTLCARRPTCVCFYRSGEPVCTRRQDGGRRKQTIWLLLHKRR